MRVYWDWNCRLLPGMFEHVWTAEECLKVLSLLSERTTINRFCFMPDYDCSAESVSVFLIRLQRALDEVQPLLPKNLHVCACGRAALLPGLSQTEHLDRLILPRTDYLPIFLPLTGYRDYMDVELNRLLYHSKFRLLFTSFDHYPVLYPPDMIDRLIRLPNVAYQFNYKSLSNPQMIQTLKVLLQRNAPILFGTSVNCMEKAAFYDFYSYLNSANKEFNEFERDDLFFSRRIYRK